MMVMVSSTDLITLFVGLELSSIGIYILVGYIFPNRASLEGAVKYLILGAFATAFLLFGFGLLYAASGTMDLMELSQKLAHEGDIWMKMGILFTLVGVAFKLALFPFHMWAPDAYESAPTGITALMASSVKIMILILALRISHGLPIYYEQWYPILFVLSVLSMIGGNILALVQTSVKRMLAYSSIAHSGYMAIVLCVLHNSNAFAYQAILFYLIGYTLSTILAFGTLMWLEDTERQNIQLQDLRGLTKTHPWAALALSIAMFSFAGMPPTVGFFAKFFVFNAALQGNLYWLVIMGVVGSIISLYYYLRVIVTMYMQKIDASHNSLSTKTSSVTAWILVSTCIAIIIFGTIMPEHILISLKPIATDLVQY
jgi:NADH-quinone oxidoreductase subunit N